MRLLIFLHSLGGGGAERVTVNLANRWAANRWQITLITLASGNQDRYALHPPSAGSHWIKRSRAPARLEPRSTICAALCHFVGNCRESDLTLPSR